MRPREAAAALPVDAGGRVRSLGQSLLMRVLETRTPAEVAQRVGRHRTTIARLASGTITTDSWSLRTALWHSFGIDPEAWDTPPSA